MKNWKITSIFSRLIAVFQSWGQNNGNSQSPQELPPGTLAIGNGDYDSYLEFRNALLSINPADFGFKKSKAETNVFGIVIDLNKGDLITTISAFKTGDISVYESTGMLYMRGTAVPKFRNMALDFTSDLQKFVEQSQETAEKILPKSGYAKFYLVTTHGLRHYEGEIISIEQGNSDWKILLDGSLMIVNEYKKAVEK